MFLSYVFGQPQRRFQGPKVLDILFFRSTCITSHIIAAASSLSTGVGEFSHVGLVVDSTVMPFIKDMKPGTLYVWESTVSSQGEPLDIERKVPVSGTQIRELDAVVNNYYHAQSGVPLVAFSKLKDEYNPLLRNGRGWVVDQMWNAYQKYGRSPYRPEEAIGSVSESFAIIPLLYKCSSFLASLVSSVCCKRKKPSEDQKEDVSPISTGRLNKNNFCSGQLAAILIELGVLDPTINTSIVLPVDFLGCDAQRQIPSIIQHMPIPIPRLHDS